MADGSLQTMNATARNCFYTGTVTNHEFSRVAIDMCNGEMVCRSTISACIMYYEYIVYIYREE